MHFVTDAGAERLDVGWMTPNGFAFLGVRLLSAVCSVRRMRHPARRSSP